MLIFIGIDEPRPLTTMQNAKKRKDLAFSFVIAEWLMAVVAKACVDEPQCGMRWLTGFAMVTKVAKVFQIEARAIVERLKLAWLKGYKQIEINCDNAMFIDILCNGFPSISNITEVLLIHEWCNKD
ncbi:hypothetical protein J1N35_025149 [Gossypium stocksii]|uniref:RNase H type-1 domain-containing protein n=1 Tax=Gossypium stocksii TaxID=47602 RepID=A0A9D3V627_9ROSI|nr:hypothetical protein J1N35_025149 [Gossypium stocksii]